MNCSKVFEITGCSGKVLDFSEASPEYIETLWIRKNRLNGIYLTLAKRVNRDFHTNLEAEISSVDITKNHPVLGVDYSQSSYSQPELYKYIEPTEPQLTKALAYFLNENQESCRAFVQAVLQLLKRDCSVCDKATNFECVSEEPTVKKKRIDDVIRWKDNILCMEVKFNAPLQNNLLGYQRHIEKKYKLPKNDAKPVYVVISIKNITDEIRKNLRKSHCHKAQWINVLWADLLRTWERIISDNNIKEDTDFTRYRSSVWHKILQ